MADIRPLSELLAKKAQHELNEDPSKIEEILSILREWIQKQSYIRARTDSQFLIAFLRSNKFSIEKAKQKIESYYKVRDSIPEVFANRKVDIPKLQEIIKLGVGLILPKSLGEDGPRISIIRAGGYDPNIYDIKDIVKAGTLSGDIQILEDDNIIIAGHLEILDLANITLGHAKQMNATFLKKLAILGERGTPLRHKGLHFINTPPGFDTFFNIFKRFLGEKSRTRLYSHGTNMDSLYKFVPRHLLPIEYGGENGSIADVIAYWEKKISDYRDYFNEEEQYGIVDKFRMRENTLDADSVFGFDGTFRQLHID